MVIMAMVQSLGLILKFDVNLWGGSTFEIQG